MVMPVTQKLLLRYMAHINTRFWLRASFIGYLAGIWLCMTLPMSVNSDRLFMALLFTPAGVMQQRNRNVCLAGFRRADSGRGHRSDDALVAARAAGKKQN
jgi:hypothetical protein